MVHLKSLEVLKKKNELDRKSGSGKKDSSASGSSSVSFEGATQGKGGGKGKSPKKRIFASLMPSADEKEEKKKKKRLEAALEEASKYDSEDFDWDRDKTRGVGRQRVLRTRLPENSCVSGLVKQCWDVRFKGLQCALQANLETPWDDPIVLEAAYELLKHACALLPITISDIRSMLKKQKEERKRAIAKAEEAQKKLRGLIKNPNAYRLYSNQLKDKADKQRNTEQRPFISKESCVRQPYWYCSRTMFYFYYIYTLLKLEITWEPKKHQLSMSEDLFAGQVREGHASVSTNIPIRGCSPKFFQPGTYQFKFRELYNNCCRYMRDFLTEDGDPAGLDALVPPEDTSEEVFVAYRSALVHILSNPQQLPYMDKKDES